MADTDQAALQRRATWVGLRTLRQRPKMVGETPSGEPVFEVKSVRLVLRDEAGHFSRLAECSKCGREVPGAPVTSPADLDRPAHSVICKDCVRAAGVARPLQPERRAPKPEAPSAEPANQVPEPAEAVEDVRLAAMEVQLQAAIARLAHMADVDRVEAAESRVHEALRQGLAEIRAELTGSSERGAAEQPDDDEARKQVEALAQVVQAQQGRFVSLTAVLDEIRADMQRLAESNEEVARAQADLQRRIDHAVATAGTEGAELAQRLRTDGANLTRLVESNEDLARAQADLERRVEEAVAKAGTEARAFEQALRGDVANLTRPVESNQDLARAQAELDQRIDEAVARAGTDATALERRLRGDVEILTQQVAQLREDLEAPLGAPVRDGLGMVIQAIQELARSRDEIKAGVDLRLETLTSAVDDGDDRLRTLDLRMNDAIERLTAALDDHRRELKEVGAATSRLDQDIAAGQPAGELLDVLERQLQQAEGRLARLTAGPDAGVRSPPDG